MVKCYVKICHLRKRRKNGDGELYAKPLENEKCGVERKPAEFYCLHKFMMEEEGLPH